MRRLLLVLTIVALLFVRVPLHADDLRFDLFGAYLESLRTQVGIPGLSAAIVGENDILWERALGRQDLQRFIATRTDTPFHLNGLTQLFTASLVLSCVEDGHFSLDDSIGRFDSDSPDANSTIRQVLTHTSGAPDSLVFAYRPERLAPLRLAVRMCTDSSYRENLANLLEGQAMFDSVPGADAIHLVPPAEGIPDGRAVERYTSALERLAVPYAVDKQRRASPSEYTATTLTPASGLISTVRDFAKFDLALRQGVLLHADTLAAAWRAPLDRSGQPLPHGMGWFVQTYNGLTVVWQFGEGENASSSLVVTVPARGLTLVLLANSDGLAKQFSLTAGNVTTSPFARVFLALFAR